MIAALFRLLRRIVSLLLLVAILLLLPVGYVELACRGDDRASADWAEAAALARPYAALAQGYAGGTPHEARFVGLIVAHWAGLCAAAPAAPAAPVARVPAYGAGAYLTADLALRGAYEETLGRAYAVWRGAEPAPLDTLAADQVAAFAAFVQTEPWYDWDFPAQARALTAARTEAQRDWERWIALGAGAWTRAGLAWITRQIAPPVAQPAPA